MARAGLKPRFTARHMKKKPQQAEDDNVRPEYDLTKLGPGVRGKYFRQATSGTNLVLIEPDLAEVFPDGDSVNRALRILAEAAAAVKRRTDRRRGAQ